MQPVPRTSLEIKHVLIIFLIIIVSLSISGCNQFAKMIFQPYIDYLYDGPMDAETANKELAKQLAAGISGAVWQCKDVAGEISAQKASAEAETYGTKTILLKDTWLDLSITGEDSENVELYFDLKIALEEGIIDANTEKIIAWNEASWTKNGKTSVTIFNNGFFSGVVNVTVIQNWTQPTSGSQESTEPHGFFGLIPPYDISTAYLCDRRANQIPEWIDNLTGKNFRSYCQPGYYYECDLTP